MANIVILYFSGYGHTEKQAESVEAGLLSVKQTEVVRIGISENGEISEQDWQVLNHADGILFGAPTYMGSAPWQFKRVADESSKIWFTAGWKDKLAAGFTNSASINGDKDGTVGFLKTFAAQHGMLWVSTGLAPSNSKAAQRNDINYLGGYSGLLAQSPSDSSPEEGPLPGDLATAEAFGKRFAEAVNRWAS